MNDNNMTNGMDPNNLHWWLKPKPVPAPRIMSNLPASIEMEEPAEITMQSHCTTWFWNTYIDHRRMLFHVQNKARNRIEGNKFKAMGIVKGPSDLVLIIPREVHFIELKTTTGSQSSEQIEFQDKVEMRGHQYHIARSLEEFKALILSLLGPPKDYSSQGIKNIQP